ncbi:hypothetical protein [Nocardioides sp. SLBN-35]|uniref:hypothetical protein n=1 Tax=Nocardioides sp. SLBN-35 TaxID=2768445 RepID=UPI00114DCB7D|nr:hypothetical protein [Nocardioides sp. SLBN-35]TQK68273.1 hypothetical protein FBY23_0019 [Nocardioides sp. SLBN-35]
MSSTEAFDEVVGHVDAPMAADTKKDAFYLASPKLDYFKGVSRVVHGGRALPYIDAPADKCDVVGLFIAPTMRVHSAGIALLVTSPTSEPAQQWPASAMAYDHARAEMKHINAELHHQGLSGIPELASSSMRHALRDVLAADSIYPSMSLDEDRSLLAEWRYGAEAIEVETTASGVFSWTHYRDGQIIKSSTSRTHLRQVLRDLTATVEAANPNWRSLFRTHAHR